MKYALFHSFQSCLLVFVWLLYPHNIEAVPVNPAPLNVCQPDGNVLVLSPQGDEFFHYMNTQDGYTVMQNQGGYYVYAEIQNHSLVPGKIVAHNRGERKVAELAYLQNVKRGLATDLSAQRITSRAQTAFPNINSRAVSSQDFHGLVILVQFSDVKFKIQNPQEAFNRMTCQTGYDVNGATGSVRDYFYDNSMGKFEPHFTVTAPVTLDKPLSYYGANVNGQDGKPYEMVKDACSKIDSEVDFSQFDLDGDGSVDMVYVIYAGYAESSNADVPDLIWPHASYISPTLFDGVKVSRYACSAELGGRYNDPNATIDGIGTLCHEFSHVLGLPDLYDTDYEGSGGQSADPGVWSIMAGGSYLNESRTPAGYSAFERYVVGWSTPEILTEKKEYFLSALNECNCSFRIDATSPNEFFIIENRQQSGWDSYLPGHGMLIFRVDSTDVNVWQNNTLNANPAHQYYQLLRANNDPDVWGNLAGNPFPGSDNITEISDATSPGLISWSGAETGVSLTNITEQDGNIAFCLSDGSLKETLVEDFESMVKDNPETGTVDGKFIPWLLNNARIVPPPAGMNDIAGEKIVLLSEKGVLEMVGDITGVREFSFLYANKGVLKKTLNIQYSIDKGVSWQTVLQNGSADIVVDDKSLKSISVQLKTSTSIRFRIVAPKGNVYIDDVTFNRLKAATAIINTEKADTELRFYTSGDGSLFVYLMQSAVIEVFNQSGYKIAEVYGQEGWNTLHPTERGILILRAMGKVAKVGLY
ncbi:M6 family metalloprotease domain-containing protein [Bacteroides sp.]